MYQSMIPMLAEATRLGYTVGAFNAHNLEMVPAMIGAARDLGAPIIIQISTGNCPLCGDEESGGGVPFHGGGRHR